MTKFIVTNFAYGTGPYLRTTELALAFNQELERRGRERLGIIVPWVYGEKQKTVMSEEFGIHMNKHPHEIRLDLGLGSILKKVFYEGSSYADYLHKWIKSFDLVVLEANKYLKDKYGSNLLVELNRSPRVCYNIAPAYSTSFGHISEMLEQANQIPDLKISQTALNAGIKIATLVEKSQKIIGLSFPSMFSHLKNRQPRYSSEIEVPLIMNPPNRDTAMWEMNPSPASYQEAERGIFVTVSGIPGLERLYSEISKLGVKIYSNNPEVILGSVKASPRVMASGNVLFQFARAGWNSVWLSLLSGVPLMVPSFDLNDDPEIYFNNLAVEKLGISMIYRGQTMNELLKESIRVKEKCVLVKKKIIDRWGTLDGNQYCAKLFVDDFIKSYD